MSAGLMPPRTLGVAVVGLGVGEQHAFAYQRIDECIIRWVYDINPVRIELVLAQLGAGTGARDFETILADESVDVVSIASYDDAHFTQTVAALDTGKHVFVEKPLCRSLEELRGIKYAWLVNADLHLTSNLVLRAAPVYFWLREVIASGELGEIYAFDGDYLYGRMEKITTGWRKDVDAFSVMQGGGVHLVDLMMWLTDQRPKSVTTMGNRISTAGTRFRYNDFVASNFQFPSGLVGRISANFGCVHRHQHVLRVFGTKGTFINDDQGPRLHLSRDPALSAGALNLPTLPASKGELIPSFVRAILSTENPRPKAQYEFDLISTCLASDRALAEQRMVEIDYI